MILLDALPKTEKEKYEVILSTQLLFVEFIQPWNNACCWIRGRLEEIKGAI